MTAEQNIQDILSGDLGLDSQRRMLKTQSYTDAFPGSQEWRDAKKYEAALEKFDEEHPEIVAQIKADDAAKKQKEKQAVDKLGWI